jgi:hypothetical protein
MFSLRTRGGGVGGGPGRGGMTHRKVSRVSGVADQNYLLPFTQNPSNSCKAMNRGPSCVLRLTSFRDLEINTLI